ncbi:MAG TPA: hypothetical protein VMH83_07890 [Candidatus Acidoferrum sp.]|nr:hypothetical protein [Candidatus Acidoferrum sp.]
MRQTIKITALLVALLLMAACGKAGPDDDDAKKKAADKVADKKDSPGIELTAEQSQALGLVTVKLQAISHRDQVTGYGQVLAVDTIVQDDAVIVAAEATAAQSVLAAARAKELYSGDEPAISREVWELAVTKSSVDQAALVLARRKAAVAFGLNAPWRSSNEQRTAVLAKLLAGTTVMVKVTFPPGTTLNAKSFNVARVGTDGKQWTATSVWEAPADAAIPGRSLFALVDGSGLVPNERVIAGIAIGDLQQGVRVPATALVLGESDGWVYVKHDDAYVRTRIDTSHPDGDGYFVAAGLEPEQEVVTGGAGQLYAREINPANKADD